MEDDMKKRVEIAQASIVTLAESDFSEPQLEDLRVLVRLTLEFEAHLQHVLADPGETVEQMATRIFETTSIYAEEWRYANDSTFSGIDAFLTVNWAYRPFVGSRPTTIDWATASPLTLAPLFARLCGEFIDEADFMRKCRLLLDLFKIQIVLAGMLYD